MDDSKFYRDWLDLEVPPGITPTYYQLLGLAHLEKRVPVIQAAVKARMEHFRHIDFGQDREIYQRLLQLLVEARFVLLTSELKREYDMRCSQEGKKQWQAYERPSRITRFKQVGMISIAFLLGLSVSLVMAMTVARNLDGTVRYSHSRTVAKKAEWFTSPPGKVFPRPTPPLRRQLKNNRESDPTAPSDTASSLASRENSSLASRENEGMPSSSPTLPVETRRPSEASGDEEEDIEVRTAPRLRENRPRHSPLHRLMAERNDTTVAINKSEEVPSSEDEVSQPLPEGTGVDLPDPTPSLSVSPPAAVRNPLESDPALSIMEKEEPSLVDESLAVTENVAEQATENVAKQATENVSTNVPTSVPTSVPSVPTNVPEEAEAVSLVSARDLLRNAQSLPRENPDRTLLFQKALDSAIHANEVSLAFTILEAMQESYHLPMLALKQKTLLSLTKTMTEIAPRLQDKKPLEELEQFGWKVSLELLEADQCQEAAELYQHIYEATLAAPKQLELDTARILEKKESYQKIYSLYLSYMEAVRKLETEPDDPQANRKVALWHLQKRKDLQAALPYFAKCDQRSLQLLAAKELEALANITPNAQKLLEVADGWWDLAQVFSKEVRQVIYNHATQLYEKIDQNRLDQGEQVRVVERIEKQRK